MTSRQKSLLVSLGSLFLLLRICEARLRGASTEPGENMFDGSLVDHPTGNFSPLPCNDKLQEDPCETKWTSLFGTERTFVDTVTIECGSCVVMDVKTRGWSLELQGGLDIQGKLVFPDESHIHMKTTHILVQGELHMISTKPIDGLPSIRINWMESAETPPRPIAFRPNSTENDACGGDFHECNLGQRPFVVAGGKVVMEGLPSPDMPTWVSLVDVDDAATAMVSEKDFPQYHPPPNGCPKDGIFIHENFSKAPPSYFGGSYGTPAEWTGHSLRVSRTHAQNGPIVDLRDIRGCLQPATTYIVEARVRLPDGKGPTECGEIGTHCITITSKYSTAKGTERKLPHWREKKSMQSQHGQDILIHTKIEFLEDEVDANNVFHILHLWGPVAEQDMELLEFSLYLPPPEAFPDLGNVCERLVPGNGDAELFSVSTFPFQVNNNLIQLDIGKENNNQYFQITGREFAPLDQNAIAPPDKVGITWDVPRPCIRVKANYHFRAGVRVHSDKPVVIVWHLQGITREGERVDEILAKCRPSKREWVRCDSGFVTLSASMAHSRSFSVVAEVRGDNVANYDVDDLSFEMIKGPTDRLVLPRSIQNNWAKGAHLLITSSSTKWDSWETAEIAEIDDYDSDNVRVKLSHAIEHPFCAKHSKQYATEIVLLSRNIAFEDGGHFTVLHTPSVSQFVEGVDFNNWGVAGVRDHYPIHLDNLQDGTGTVISKNTIRNARQRCVVLHSTNNVRVEQNVAFNTAGHCFALEGGMEYGNVFKGNIGAFNKKATTMMAQMGVSGKETDDTPATFWITSPLNIYMDNVVAGSESHGYWMQLRERPRGPHSSDVSVQPSHQNLGLFENNVAHSIGGSPLRVQGYHPPRQAEFEGFRAFLSMEAPVEIIDSQNLRVTRAVFDRPFDTGGLVELENPSVIDLRKCLNRTHSKTSGDVDVVFVSQDHPHHVAPSAPGVFNLEAISNTS